MPFSQSNGVVVNKPIGLVGKSTDLRSQIYDSNAFAYRDYTSTSEVLSWLVGANPTETAQIRSGHFPIYVTSGGTTTIYYFKDGTADGNLVPMITGGSATTDASLLSSGILAPARIADTSIVASKLAKTLTPTVVANNTTVAAWGDSLTKGTGGFPTPEFPDGTPWMATFKNLTGFNFFNGGYPGQISTVVRNNMLADTAKHAWPTIIWVGTNNLGDNATILADIAAMVASLGHTRYLVVNLPGHSSSSFWSGTSGYNTLQQLNASIASTYGVRAVDIRTPLVAAYNPQNSQDVIDHGHDIVPTSLMYSGDVVHFADAGYRIIGQTIAAKAQYLYSTGVDEAVVTTNGLNTLLSSPLGIGISTPNVGRFTSVAINKSLVEDVTIGLSSQPTKIVLDIAGSFRVNHPTGNAGLLIKPKGQNEGEYSSYEISGTSAGWTVGKGMIVYNNIQRIDFGSEVQMKADLTVAGGLNTQNIVSTGTIYAGAFASAYPATRALDLTYSTGYIGGAALPIVGSTASEPGLFTGKRNEIFFNEETGRWRVGHKYTDNPNLVDYKTLAYTDEISDNVFTNGAGISITQSGKNVTIANALLAPAAQLSGTPIENSAPNSNWDNSAPTYSPDKAFDNNVNTFYKSAPSDISTNRWFGLDFGSKYILTKFQLICLPGYDYVGAKLQGSNDNTTYTDIFTISTVNTFNDIVNEYPVQSITPYRYVRLLQTPQAYLLGVKELKIFGYQSSEISVTPGGALTLNSSTKVLDLPAATNSVDGYLTATDHATFAAKQGALTLTTTGTSGAATLIGNTLNIPQYSGSASSAILYSTTGANTDGAMTQAATTTALGLKANSANASFTGTFFSAGDIEITTIGAGIIMKSPDGTRYRYTPANGGALAFAAI